MNLKSRQVKGIIGMAMAVLGGVAWFYQFRLEALFLWGGAAVILFMINKKRRKR